MADTTGRIAASATTSNADAAPARWRRLAFGSRPRRTALRAAALAAAAYVVFGHALIPVRGEGPSMQPTLRDGQLALVNRLAYWRSDPRRGDVVALSLAGRRVMYIKRIVGLPGERIRIAAGVVYVDDVALDEPYVERRAAWDVPETHLSRGEYLLIGDNRGMSIRQHDFGRAPRRRIVGRVVSW
jgi:signal peptidase I